MMMAFEPGQNAPGRLDDDTIAALRDALRLYLADDSHASALKSTLLRMSVEAREKQMRAEHVLVLLKDAWSALPEVRSMTDTEEQVRLLQRVVTMCIREYYA